MGGERVLLPEQLFELLAAEGGRHLDARKVAQHREAVAAVGPASVE